MGSRGRLRLMLRLRPIPTTDTATADMVLATAVDTPALDTPVSATAVATSEDMATAMAVVTDTTVRLTQPKDKHNAGAQLSPELASVSALSYLTAGYYLATKESKLKYISCKCEKKKKKKKKDEKRKKKKKKKKKKK